ncbi:hypothetical protein D3C85_764790 [compost metagenome]
MLEVQVGIDLRGLDVGMAEQFLHRAQVLGGLQQMAGEGVPQHVRVQMLAQFTNSGLVHPQLDGSRGEATALLADEDRLLARVGHGAQG